MCGVPKGKSPPRWVLLNREIGEGESTVRRRGEQTRVPVILKERVAQETEVDFGKTALQN